jgi:DNA modification methylase
LKNETFSANLKLLTDSNLGSLVTPRQNKSLPVYNWYNYRHGYSRDLVYNLIDLFELKKGERILDPFCGGGTTLLAAKEKEISSYGVDILPTSVLITNSKLLNYNKHNIYSNILELEDFINKSIMLEVSFDKIKFKLLEKYFTRKTLQDIFKVLAWIKTKRNTFTKHFFLIALFSILEDISYAKKDGAFLRIRGSDVRTLKQMYFPKLFKMYKDLNYVNQLPKTAATVMLGDARKTGFGVNSFSGIITSPPYLNRHDYTRIYLLELIIGFIKNDKELKGYRYNSIRSHVEAKERFKNKNYEESIKLNSILFELDSIDLPNAKVKDMIRGYFKDMHLFLLEMKRVLKKKGKVAIILGDSRYGGINIPVNDFVINISKKIGFKFLYKLNARERGNSPQQMKEFGKVPIEECILLMEKV